MVCRCTGLLAAALLVFTAVEAGVLPRYRNGYTPPVRGRLQQLPAQSQWSVADLNDRWGRATVQARNEEDLSSSNHQPAKLLRAHRLPRKFDWCDPLDKVRIPVTHLPINAGTLRFSPPRHQACGGCIHTLTEFLCVAARAAWICAQLPGTSTSLRLVCEWL